MPKYRNMNLNNTIMELKNIGHCNINIGITLLIKTLIDQLKSN